MRVDGVKANLPVKLGDIRIFRAGRQIRVKTRTGVTVYWNGRHFMKSRLHMDYAGETCGLCGNFNSDPNDDLLTPEGNLVSHYVVNCNYLFPKYLNINNIKGIRKESKKIKMCTFVLVPFTNIDNLLECII